MRRNILNFLFVQYVPWMPPESHCILCIIFVAIISTISPTFATGHQEVGSQCYPPPGSKAPKPYTESLNPQLQNSTHSGSQKSILRDAVSDLALHYLAKLKILLVKDIERDEIEFTCKTLQVSSDLTLISIITRHLRPACADTRAVLSHRVSRRSAHG